MEDMRLCGVLSPPDSLIYFGTVRFSELFFSGLCSPWRRDHPESRGLRHMRVVGAKGG